MPVGRKVVSLEGQADERLAAAPDEPLALWVTCGVTRLSWPRAWPEAAGTSQPQVHLWVISRRDLGSGRVCCPSCGNLVTRSLRQGRLSRVMLSSFIKCLLSPTSRSPWGPWHSGGSGRGRGGDSLAGRRLLPICTSGGGLQGQLRLLPEGQAGSVVTVQG